LVSGECVRFAIRFCTLNALLQMVCRSAFVLFCFPDTYHRCLFVLQVISFFLPPPLFFGFIFSPISGHLIRDRRSLNCVCIIIVLCFFISNFVSCGNPGFCLIAASGLMTRDALLV
jgi:hypothetical protein